MGREDKLLKLRGQLDVMDDELLTLLGKRFNIVREIGKLKQANGLPELVQISVKRFSSDLDRAPAVR